VHPAFNIPSCDEAEFGMLPADARNDWFTVRQIVRDAMGARRPRTALRDAAAAMAREGRGAGMSFKTLQRAYYDVLHGESWRCLCDRRRLNGGGRSRWVTPDFMAWWHAEIARWTRGHDGWGGVAGAHRELIRRYRAGETVGGVNWTQVWDDLHGSRFDRPAQCPPDLELPPGWGYDQLCRRKPPKVFLVAASQGKGAARALMPQVLTTREGLEPGMVYAWDDLWHDFDVVYGAQIVRILELNCIDVASGEKPAYLFRPRVRDEATGKRSNLCETDMVMGVTALLTMQGHHPDRCVIHCEGGTAHLPDDYIRRLEALTAGRVRVEWSRPDRSPALACHWQGAAKGNPKGKRWVESSHNLSHNVLAGLAGQLGSDSRSNKPEWVAARTRAVQLMVDVADGVMSREEAAALSLPLLRYAEGRDLIAEAYDAISRSRNHRLEGWSRHMKMRWRPDPASAWHGMEELDEIGRRNPTSRMMLEAVIRSGDPAYVEEVRMSRREVWAAGASKLVRIPPHHAAALLYDLAKPRKVPDRAEIRFDDAELDPAPMVYRLAECRDPAGCRAALEPGSEIRCIINPFDAARTLHVMSADGRYLGAIGRIPVAHLVDPLEVESMVRDTSAAVNRQLTDIKRMGLPLTRARLDKEHRNLDAVTRVSERLRGEAADAQAEGSDARARRRAAARTLIAQPCEEFHHR
jgi:hypothetical protein